MYSWMPIAILPNVSARQSIDGEVIALAPSHDPRVLALTDRHQTFNEFIKRFVNTFGVGLSPLVLIVRNDAEHRLYSSDGYQSFRDLVAMCVIPYGRALAINTKNPHQITYSSFFWFHPWTLAKDNEHLIAMTPALQGLHVVDEFLGQSSPELSPMVITELEESLFDALLKRWTKFYVLQKKSWKDRALFRSLNMANQAAQLPAGTGTTTYDVGRMIALWVSAFEILVHPGKGKSGLDPVYRLLEQVPELSPKLRARRYVPYRAYGKKPWPRGSLLCWVYGKLYRARCDFLHGNPIKQRILNPNGAKAGLFWTAPLLYRLALSAFLGLPLKNKLRSNGVEDLGMLRHAAHFKQRAIQQALLQIRK